MNRIGGVAADGACGFFFFQAEDGIRDLVRSRGLGDVYKRQVLEAVDVRRDVLARGDAPDECAAHRERHDDRQTGRRHGLFGLLHGIPLRVCLLYTSDAADERSSVDLGGRRIIKKNKHRMQRSDESK